MVLVAGDCTVKPPRAAKQLGNVRFGSKADMCSAKGHVRFVPKADILNASLMRYPCDATLGGAQSLLDFLVRVVERIEY